VTDLFAVLSQRCLRLFDSFSLRDSTEALVVWPAESYRRTSMDRSITTKACVIASLLCVVLTCMAIHAPHCDVCDRSYSVISSSLHHPLAHDQIPATPDTCNGICSCCGFHGLPNAGPLLALANKVTTGVWPQPRSPVRPPRSPLFRPPRTAISS
jgi:hypothetical protein